MRKRERKDEILNQREFYEMLDIDTPEDFQYFENLAAFLECEEEPEYEDVAGLFTAVDKDVLAQLHGREEKNNTDAGDGE